jgi:hypothetical protein
MREALIALRSVILVPFLGGPCEAKHEDMALICGIIFVTDTFSSYVVANVSTFCDTAIIFHATVFGRPAYNISISGF